MSVSASWLDPITNFDLSTSTVVTEAIWDNVMSNLEYIGAAVEPDTLVNRSGGARAAGDVVIADVSNDRSFTTTTVASDVRVIGVVMDTVANGASGRIGTAGVVNVKMHTPVTRGNFIAAGSTAGYAKDIGASKIEGSFGISLSTILNGASASVPVLLKTSLGGGGGDTTAAYVVLNLVGTLTNERTLTGTANQIVLTDGGAGGSLTLSTPQDTHTGASPTFHQISASLLKLLPIGTDTSATGELRFSEIAAQGSNTVILKAPSAILNNATWKLPDHVGTSGQVLATLGTDASGIGSMYWATKPDYTINASGNTPISNAAYLKEGANIILTQSGTSITITGSAMAGGDTTAAYITLNLSTSLTNERTLTGTANQIILTDGGAGGSLVLSTPQSLASSNSVVFAQVTGGSVITSNIQLSNGSLVFTENAAGSNVVALRSPSAILNDVTWTIPDHIGASGQFLGTYGSTNNNLYWGDVSAPLDIIQWAVFVR